MIKFGVSTWLWTSPFDKSSLHLFKNIKDMGFDSVEIPIEDPDNINIDLIKEYRDEFDLTLTVCGAFGPGRDLTSDEPWIVRKGFAYIKDCLDICEALDVPFLAGPMYSQVGKARALSAEMRKVEWDRAVKGLTRVCKRADDRGLNIALEPLNRFESDMINTTADVKRLIKDIDHPRAKICLDSFHMSIEEPDIQEAVRSAGKDLIHVQVSENHRGIPGSGTTHWNGFKNGLTEIEYRGQVVIESFTPDNKDLAGSVCVWHPLAGSQDEFAIEGLKFLKKLFKEQLNGKKVNGRNSKTVIPALQERE